MTYVGTEPATSAAAKVVLDGSTLRESLSAAITLLRGEGEAAAMRVVEALVEAIDSLDAERRALAESATESQRAVLVELLRNRAIGRDRRHLSRVLSGIDTVVDLVASSPEGELPDLSRLAICYARCDLSTVLRRCGDAFRDLAANRHLAYRVEAPASVPAVVDVEKVERVALNLLFNAFKVTGEGGSIALRVEHDEDLEEVVLSVCDNGPGVGAQLREAIFTRHRWADRSGPVTAEWLGFDLAASRDLVRLHGGDLRLVQRPPGCGAEFRAHLPVRPPSGPAVGDPPPPSDLAARVARVADRELQMERELHSQAPPASHRPLVLVVEDSRSMHRVVTAALEPSCDVASAFDGQRGLAMAERLGPDLIVTDLGLPELDGAEMVRAIRARPALDSVPILVVSARRDATEIVALLRDGVQDVMGKPFLVPELAERARNPLEAKRARDVLGELLGERETDLGRLAAEVTRKQRRLEAALDEVRASREQAEGASRVKSNFLRMMSHELKTPVTALMLQLQILSHEQLVVAGPSRVRKGFGSMSRSISRLLNIVDTMLEWARVESGRFEPSPRPIEIGDAIGDAVSEVYSRADHKGISVTVSTQPSARALHTDPRLLQLVLLNLLERAINVTPEGGRVSVSSTTLRDEYRILVADDGPPLAAHEQRELFDALEPTRDLHRVGGHGSGLGLHVVSDLAHAIGGELSLVSSNASGTTVELLLGDLPISQAIARKE